jgi:hypothetical protein
VKDPLLLHSKVSPAPSPKSTLHQAILSSLIPLFWNLNVIVSLTLPGFGDAVNVATLYAFGFPALSLAWKDHPAG